LLDLARGEDALQEIGTESQRMDEMSHYGSGTGGIRPAAREFVPFPFLG